MDRKAFCTAWVERHIFLSHGQKGICIARVERHLLTHFAPKKFPPHGQKGRILPQKNEFAPQKPQKNEAAPQKNEVFEGQPSFKSVINYDNNKNHNILLLQKYYFMVYKFSFF